MKSRDIWNLVGETFNEKLPRRTAVLVKEDDWELPFAYPCDFGKIGWLIDSRIETTYDERPIASLTFGEYSYPDLSGVRGCKNAYYFENMVTLPSMVRRKIIFSNLGLEAKEVFANNPSGGFSWELELDCKLHHPLRFEKKMYLIASLSNSASIKVSDSPKLLHAKMKDHELFLCCPFDNYGVYNSLDSIQRDIAKGSLSHKTSKGRYVVFEFHVSLAADKKMALRFGISTKSADRAVGSFKAQDIETRLKKSWNKWFLSLPKLKFESDREAKAYYKCWWVIRSNYYNHPKWGRTILESLPVYRGFWQWSMNAVEWHCSMNPTIGHEFVKKLLDLFFAYQRDDGFVTHVMYLDEKVPGEGCSRLNLIQTPHFPWVALRYYHATKDVKSLKKWYAALVKYYDYLNESRDNNFLKLHLWAITNPDDSGLDTTPQFEKLRYGEKKEKFCYPAIFAAERCRYEQAMGQIAQIIKISDGRDWHSESEITRQKMNDVLWDKRKKWYGVLHADLKRSVCVGIDGLFPLAYGIADKTKAQQARNNFTKLLDKYGVHTFAPDEQDFRAHTYWRGPAWTKSCSLAMAAAYTFYPDLIKIIKSGLLEFLLRHPSVWECKDGHTGEIARGDAGMMAGPMMSSNVGAGEAIGALRIAHGDNVYSM
jgi:hypothetical protein